MRVLIILIALFTTLNISAKTKPCYRIVNKPTGYTDPQTGVTTYKTATTDDAVVEGVNSTVINCNGSGSNTCPSCPLLVYPTITYSQFELDRYSSLSNHAELQIETGNQTGVYSESWVNIDTGLNQIFVVEWSVDSQTGIQSMVIYIQ
ncbi:MAG TPA: hypothetical protein DIW47_14420 [Bacteroidetes bacterium]|nr:hypothetical protein [Bacteroidota bacterium]